MKVRWSPEARRDRAAIWEYLEARDPHAAVRIDMLISDVATKLTDFPMLGASGRRAGNTRVHSPS